MVSRKNERLVNLTIALLATKRYLTKNEIFRNIEGYEGSAEAKERMFERDKDDLRKLGIQIEVGGLDPLFDDEAGYRIRPESYALSLRDLTPTQVTLLSLAAQAWQDAAFTDLSQQALRKLTSIGLDTDSSQLPVMAPRLVGADENLRGALDALTSLTTIEFDYLNIQGIAQKRQLQVYGVQARKSNWYLIGLDTEKNAIRNFRVDRIQGGVDLIGKSQSYVIPPSFEITELEPAIATPLAVLQVRPGAGYQLRRLATTVETADDWDVLELPIFDLDFITSLVLWHGEDVMVSSPPQLRSAVMAALEELVKIHG
jgi:proteasome accessory factor B